MKARCLVNILFVGGILCAAILALAAGGRMKITSPAFQEGGNIPQKFTCDGANLNPALRLEGITADAKSLVLIVDDPDAPGGLFTHWLIWNIDPKASEISEGGAPKGVPGKNDFGKSGYGGPCPPSGTHRYFFKVFALDRELDLPAGSKRAQLDAAMRGHVIGQGEVMGRYTRAH
jgi:Raf kinase inhibitor-like YbhB/YbcL family protein